MRILPASPTVSVANERCVSTKRYIAQVFAVALIHILRCFFFSLFILCFTKIIIIFREWEKLAASVKGMVTIAYWDTEGGSRPPRLLGEYQGTPTIRLFSPKRKPRKQGSVSEKNILDYQHGERTSTDMRKFLEYQLPNYAERVRFGKDDYDRFANKAERFGLPLVVVFTTKAKTSSTIKWLSAEYRRKILLVEVPPSDKNAGLEKEIFGELGNRDDDGVAAAATLYVLAPDKKVVRYEGDSFARRKLQDFLKTHALEEPALEPIASKKPAEEAKPQEKAHDEF